MGSGAQLNTLVATWWLSNMSASLKAIAPVNELFAWCLLPGLMTLISLGAAWRRHAPVLSQSLP